MKTFPKVKPADLQQDSWIALLAFKRFLRQQKKLSWFSCKVKGYEFIRSNQERWIYVFAKHMSVEEYQELRAQLEYRMPQFRSEVSQELAKEKEQITTQESFSLTSKEDEKKTAAIVFLKSKITDLEMEIKRNKLFIELIERKS